jgi:hypothetical protein
MFAGSTTIGEMVKGPDDLIVTTGWAISRRPWKMSRVPLTSMVSPTATVMGGSFEATNTSRPAFSVAVLS